MSESEDRRPTNLRMKVDAFTGSPLEQVIRDIAATATGFNLWVECDVNGITVLCPPDANPDTMWRNFSLARERKASFVSLHVIPDPIQNQNKSLTQDTNKAS